MKILIIGAGVIGLSTGVRLLESLTNIEVTLYADKLSPNTTSDVAAGLWFPYAFGKDNKEMERWCISSYNFLTNIIKTDPNHHKYGIMLQDIYALTDDDFVKMAGVYKIFSNTRVMNAKELEMFGSSTNGIAATTFMAQGTKLMAYLMERFVTKGGKVIQTHVECIDKVQAGKNFPIIINCTGLGARQLCNDQELNPLRGQIVKVEAPWVKYAIMKGSAYILPQSDGTVVLGGTAQKDNYNLTPCHDDTKDILDKCFKILPGLKECKILDIKVGLRPYRSSVRLEAEMRVNHENGNQYTIIHNYGHGGSGLTLFWGCAGDVVDLVKASMVKARI